MGVKYHVEVTPIHVTTQARPTARIHGDGGEFALGVCGFSVLHNFCTPSSIMIPKTVDEKNADAPEYCRGIAWVISTMTCSNPDIRKTMMIIVYPANGDCLGMPRISCVMDLLTAVKG